MIAVKRGIRKEPCPRCIRGQVQVDIDGEQTCLQCGCVVYDQPATETEVEWRHVGPRKKYVIREKELPPAPAEVLLPEGGVALGLAVHQVGCSLRELMRRARGRGITIEQTAMGRLWVRVADIERLR